ncbi:uncharacterized protein LOC133188421, partial [Saccostrea echinata]|uniref:uncharacterized protein LOC133188421 n=1 Tax=Saccostrea echinata TaxID=191078 RepID=UPI002A7F2AB4
LIYMTVYLLSVLSILKDKHLIFSRITSAATCKNTVRVVTSYQARVCTCRWWGICTHHSWVWRYRESYKETCCPGYGGWDCQPICSSHCHGRGTCVAPDTCTCISGYTGNACQTPVCNPRCQHGSCTRPNVCSCYWGYSGRHCQRPVCNPACQHGGTCTRPDTCQCPAGKFTGHNCDIPICNPPCLNGGTCSNSRQCQCPSTYRGRDCGTPVCNPTCKNSGTCIYPNVCSCDDIYTGRLCETPLCSYRSPCFPGTCTNSTICQCHAGFSGQHEYQRCKTMTSGWGPLITRCTSVLANIERSGEKREKYRFVTDSSEPNSTRVDTMWVNQKDYNYINVEFAAVYTAPDDLALPKYVKRFKFGIVSGKIQIDLRKVDRIDPNNPFVSQNEVKNCSYQPGSLNPNDDIYHCNFTEENFDRLLENGDNLTLTVIAENGGFRELVGPHADKTDLFVGQKSRKSTMFRFDFEKPRHCLQVGPCAAKALDVTKDITKFPLAFIWNNWIDDLSGLQGYKLQVYLLKPNKTHLKEPFPWNPLTEIPLNVTDSSFTYIPKQAGMYSFILNVIDVANNTQYARTLALYDPHSTITLSSSPFFATSAEPETNHTWQNSLNNNITMTWKGHFENKFHETNKLLYPVARYQHFDHMTKYEKQVPSQLDDSTGNRTLKGIPNVHGIVKFEYFFRNGNQGNKTPDSWISVNNEFSENQTFYIDRRDGDTINFWVRATDAMGNKKVDMAKIFFDSTPPKQLKHSNVVFTRNVKTAMYDFSSRLQVDTFDKDSGIHKIHLELIANSSNMVFHEADIPGNKTEVEPTFQEGYRTPMGDYFYYSHYFEINNCWMVVSKEKFAAEFVLLNLTVFNRAMEATYYHMTITDLPSLDGMDKYSGPINLTVTETYDNSVRLKWIVSPTCYKRSKVLLQFRSSNGQIQTRFLDTDADWVDLTGLNSETSYNLSFVTQYGAQRSDPVFVQFRTLQSPAALTGGAIAGISITFLILLGIIIAMVVLWRLGRLSVLRDDIQRRVTVVRKNISNRFSAAHTNPSYEVDDIYVYGQMEISNTDSWILPSSNIVLDALLTSGRFADIYKARYQQQNNKDKQIVIAKTLRSDYNEENMLMMRAKINYFAKEVGKHPNLIHFVGAVVDNDAFGPYMVLEYCEKGQLRDWLLQQKNASTVDTVELLYRIVYGISKGMCYLETKKLVHKRLAARNVLLTGELEPKIYGFGPEPPQQQSNDGDGDVTSDEKERIPVKWTAPECLISMKNACTKSDVWSFGIVLWEVFTLGDTPYPGIRSRDVQTQVKNGHRMKKPEFANDFYYGIMIRCWNSKPKQRPSFKDISTDIGKTFNNAPSDEFYYYSEK